jgi:tetratricopeptide (TPR) repeat protein
VFRRYRRGAVIFFLIRAVASAGEAEGPAAPAAERGVLVQQGLTHINDNRHDAALATARELCQRYPDDAAGHFIAASSYQTVMSDYRVRSHEVEFEREIEQALRKGRARAARSPDAEAHFVVGASEGLWCVYQFKRGQRWSALNAARKSLRHLDAALRLDQGFADALLGLALYDYAKSKVRVLGLSLFPRSLRNAVTRLGRAVENARYVGINARYSQQLILYETAEFEEALRVNDALHARFPENPVCLYNRALILERLGRPAEALPIWEKLVGLLDSHPVRSQRFLAECHLHIAEIRREQGHSEAARTSLRRAAQHAQASRSAPEIDGPYVSFEKVDEAIRRAQRSWGRRSS